MNPAVDGVVAPPRADEPALADETTADLFALARSRSWQALAPISTLVLSVPLVWRAADRGGLPYALIAGAVIMGLVVTAGTVTMALPAVGWPRAVRGLLADRAWAPVPATVLRTRGTVVELADGTRFRIWWLHRPGRAVIAATGRVWLVGPAANGWFAVRVDGLHTPWPARRLARRTGDDVTPADPPGVGPLAADDAVAADWVASKADRWQFDVVVSAAVVAAGLVSVLLSGWRGFGVVFGALLVAGGLGVLGQALLRLRLVREVAAMLRAGPWLRADARLESWQKRQHGRADATVDVRLVTGEGYTVTLRSVEADLPANIWKAESVWIAGAPVPGRHSVVGFPGFPVLAQALFVADRREW